MYESVQEPVNMSRARGLYMHMHVTHTCDCMCESTCIHVRSVHTRDVHPLVCCAPACAHMCVMCTPMVLHTRAYA